MNFLRAANSTFLRGGIGISILIGIFAESTHGGSSFSFSTQNRSTGWKWKPSGHVPVSPATPEPLQKMNPAHELGSFMNPSSSGPHTAFPPPPPPLPPPLPINYIRINQYKNIVSSIKF